MEASIYKIETVAIVRPDEDSEARWLFVAGELKWIQPGRGRIVGCWRDDLSGFSEIIQNQV